MSTAVSSIAETPLTYAPEASSPRRAASVGTARKSGGETEAQHYQQLTALYERIDAKLNALEAQTFDITRLQNALNESIKIQTPSALNDFLLLRPKNPASPPLPDGEYTVGFLLKALNIGSHKRVEVGEAGTVAAGKAATTLFDLKDWRQHLNNQKDSIQRYTQLLKPQLPSKLLPELLIMSWALTEAFIMMVRKAQRERAYLVAAAQAVEDELIKVENALGTTNEIPWDEAPPGTNNIGETTVAVSPDSPVYRRLKAQGFGGVDTQVNHFAIKDILRALDVTVKTRPSAASAPTAGDFLTVAEFKKIRQAVGQKISIGVQPIPEESEILTQLQTVYLEPMQKMLAEYIEMQKKWVSTDIR